MKQMIKKMAVVLSVALVCAPMGAMGADKLIVKATDGTTSKFVVTDGDVGISAPGTGATGAGNLGVGTSTPDAGITLKSSSYPANTVKVVGLNASPGGYLAYLAKAGTTLPVNTERLAFIYMGAIYNNVTAMNATGMKAVAEGAWTTASTPAAFAFETTPNSSTTRAERMRIASSGNVGIGTTGPTQKLEIAGGVRLNTTDTKPACTASTRGTLWFEQGTTDILYVCSQVFGTPSWKAATLN